jgi:hypothetical protein
MKYARGNHTNKMLLSDTFASFIIPFVLNVTAER